METFVEIQVYRETEESLRLKAAMGDLAASVDDVYKIEYFVISLPNIDTDTRLFDKRMDIIIQRVRSLFDDIVEVGFRIIPQNEALLRY